MKKIPTAQIKVLISVFAKYKWHLGVLAVLGFFAAILEGIGINIAIPLLSFIGGGNQLPTDFISGAVQDLFGFFSIPFTPSYLISLIVGLFILRAFSSVVFGYVRGWITADFLTTESETVLKHLFSASWPFILKQKIGSLHNTLIRDIQRSGNLLESLSQAIQSFTGFIMYLVVALNISPITTLYTILGGGVLIFLIRPLYRKLRYVGESMASTEKQISQFVTEHIIGMKAVKAAAVEKPAYSYGQTLFRSLRAIYIRLSFVRAMGSSVFQPFSIIFVVVLFLLTYKTPGFSLISFAATLYLIQKIFVYLESWQGALNAVNELVPYAENIANFKKELQENTEHRVKANTSFSFKKSLVFENVSFSYQSGTSVLSNINFSISFGETIGLIGPSGAGKSSVADLLLRLFEPTGGRITLDGVSIEDISPNNWREHIGYVAQDVFLLNATIEENIRFYRNDLSHEDIVRAAKQANILNFIEGLPDVFKTLVGDRGVMLSGGQRQRVVLARALAHNPELLILDEATSALDSESERLIQEAIYALRGSVTVIMIAHRLSTVERADTIYVLDHGNIVESGIPSNLKADSKSYFYRMQHQNIDEGDAK